MHGHSTLSKALERASKLKRISVNPMLSVETAKQRKFKTSSLTILEWRRLIQISQKEPTVWQLIWRIALVTRLRQSEVLGFSWEGFNSNKVGKFVHNQLQF